MLSVAAKHQKLKYSLLPPSHTPCWFKRSEETQEVLSVHVLSLRVFCTFKLGEEGRHDPGLLPLPYNLKEVTFTFVALITDSETKALPA